MVKLVVELAIVMGRPGICCHRSLDRAIRAGAKAVL